MAEYKYEIERLSRELADLKRRWFDAKRREQQQRSGTGGSQASSQKQGGSSTAGGTPGSQPGADGIGAEQQQVAMKLVGSVKGGGFVMA